MILRLASDFRLLPVVLLATIALFALKVSGLMFDGGYTLAERLQDRMTSLQAVAAQGAADRSRIIVADEGPSADTPVRTRSWTQETFNYSNSDDGDITGSAGKDDKPAAKSGKEEPAAKSGKEDEKLKVSDKPPGLPKVEAEGASITIRPGHVNSAGERAILESLHERRRQLDAHSRELDMRENLLKAAEKRLEAKIDELKDVETRVKSEMGSRDQAEAKRLKGLVTMYSGMKPKEAARIFDRLDMKILVDVSTQMSPRTMSAILAQMTPEAAERLTVELANRAGTQPTSQNPNQLPKIEGTPSGR
jgi:flagellar motility protein MotE (MotC chaperone)